MKQVTGFIPTYSSDQFGVCSALYELGGLIVMHDASGCHSTYTTHDEPRWYDMDSMVYVSALSEMEAIMGDDEKLIKDIIEAAGEMKPAFIAVAGTPVPYMIGTDFAAIARILEDETGIPSFGFDTNGMGLYTSGISMALEAITGRFAEAGRGRGRKDAVQAGTEGPEVNIIGATPLDFSVNGSVASMKEWLTESGLTAGASIAYGCSLDEIRSAGRADVNLVVSYGGLAAARLLEKKFGTPYVIGTPVGKEFAALLADRLKEAAGSGKTPEKAAYSDIKGGSENTTVAVGESVFQCSLAAEAALEKDADVRVICPADSEDILLRDCDARVSSEDEIADVFKKADMIIADPLYRTVLPEGKTFCDLPHEAFSGRIYDHENPNLINKRLETAGLRFI